MCSNSNATATATDEQLIRQTLTHYVRFADQRNTAAWAALFTEDARFTPRNGTEYRGRATIQAWFEELFRDGGPSQYSRTYAVITTSSCRMMLPRRTAT